MSESAGKRWWRGDYHLAYSLFDANQPSRHQCCKLDSISHLNCKIWGRIKLSPQRGVSKTLHVESEPNITADQVKRPIITNLDDDTQEISRDIPGGLREEHLQSHQPEAMV